MKLPAAAKPVFGTLQREPQRLAKIYHAPTPQHETKLTAMLANPPRQPHTHTAFAWPDDLLYRTEAGKRQFAGFLMPRVRDVRAIFNFYNPIRRQQITPDFPWRYFLHHTARNLAIAINSIHTRGHVIGDINESNVLVDEQALVTLVDTDSFQIANAASNQLYRCAVGKPEFTPPELQGVDLKSVDRAVENDHFGLSVLIFLLLMEGFHPFTGVLLDGKSVGRVDLYCIKQGWFPYARRTPVTPPPTAPKLAALHPPLQEAFHRCFVQGHTRLPQRPAPAEWDTLLADASEALIPCSQAQNHVYSAHLSRCPHCDPTVLDQHRWWPSLAAPTPQLSTPQIPRLSDKRRITTTDFMAQVRKVRAKPRLAMNATRRRSGQAWATTYEFASGLHDVATASASRTLWANWVLAHVAGLVLGGAVMVLLLMGMSQSMNQAMTQSISISIFDIVVDLGPNGAMIGTCALLAAVIGSCQWWAMRQAVFRHPYARVGGAVSKSWSALLWIIVTSLAGVWGALVYFAIFEQPDPVTVTILFGAGLGLVQGMRLSPYLRRARDPRRWMLINACSWSLPGIGWIAGTTLEPEWSTLLFAALGMVLTSIITGFVLAWMARTPTYHPRQRQWASQVVRWLRPNRPRFSLRKVWTYPTFQRWVRAGLLLLILLMAVQGVLLFVGIKLIF